MNIHTIHREESVSTQDTESAEQRGLFGVLTIAGLLLCFTPLALLGIGLLVVFGFLWLFTPVVEQAEEEMIEETEQTGDGCFAFVRVILLIILIGAVAIALGVVVMMAAIGGLHL